MPDLWGPPEDDAPQDIDWQVAQNVELLNGHGDPELLATLKAVLKDRPSVVQELVDWAVPDRAYVSSRLLTDNRACGRIKTFSHSTGYGFIESQAVHDAFGNDVFLSHWQLQDFQVGDEVSFAILLGKDRKPQAYDLGAAQNGQDVRKDVQRAVKGGRALAAGGKGMFVPHGKGKVFAPARGSPVERADFAGGSGGSMSKGFKGFKGYEAGKGSKGDFKGDSKGDFKWGKGAAPSGFGKGKSTDEVFDGVIKSFNERSGYGFIACDETMAMYGGDVYLHRRSMGDCQIGEAVSFTINVKDGKPQANEVYPNGGGCKGGKGGKGRYGGAKRTVYEAFGAGPEPAFDKKPRFQAS